MCSEIATVTMKKIYIIITTALAALLCSAQAGAQTPALEGVSVSGYSLQRSGDYMTVDLDMDISGLTIGRNHAVLVTPRLVNGADSLELPSVAVYGRRRYFYYMRNGESMLAASDGDDYRLRQKPDTKTYHETYPYQDWMNGASLRLSREVYGCCNTLREEQMAVLGEYRMFEPTLVYMRPSPNKEPRALEGKAYIEFPVDRTEVQPEFRNNAAELAKIQATIDSVRNDEDITITGIWLKGFASPESPYNHNRDLAMGRTAAVRDYIQNFYSFPASTVTTDYEAENWQGLREFVDRSNLEHRAEILSIIDAEMDPDAKEAKIKATYPDEYRFLLDNCYPRLRLTAYRVNYTVRAYTSVEEIKRVLAEEPAKLSLNELYIVAQEYEPGSEEFTRIFETAAHMYPESETANLNAANAAIKRGDLETAHHYLERAGESGEADYARGVVAVYEGNYEAARPLLQSAKAKGISEADYCLGYIR